MRIEPVLTRCKAYKLPTNLPPPLHGKKLLPPPHFYKHHEKKKILHWAQNIYVLITHFTPLPGRSNSGAQRNITKMLLNCHKYLRSIFPSSSSLSKFPTSLPLSVSSFSISINWHCLSCRSHDNTLFHWRHHPHCHLNYFIITPENRYFSSSHSFHLMHSSKSLIACQEL